MNKNLLYLFIMLSAHTFIMLSKPNIASLSEHLTQEQQPKRKAVIQFDFQNEELIDIINMLAGKKRVNIVLPTGANSIKTKVTMSIKHKLTVQEAWDLLYTLLDIAGYSLIQKDDTYIVVKNDKNISKEPLPLYINIPVGDIPSTDERIRYMYYLSNLQASQEFDSQLGGMFKEILPDDAIYKADKDTNSILLIAKAQDIQSVMRIIENIDQSGFQERLEMIRLRYTTSDTIAKLFNDSILKTAASTPANRFRPGGIAADQTATFFSKNVKVISEPRTNSLIVLGRVQAVERIKDFIFKYIDVQLDSGKSILHMYELQYLDADEFAPVLQNIVEASRSGGTGQSKTAGGQQVGTERFFDQVIIQPDSPGQSSGASEGKYFGGNKLVIACRNDDWKRIKDLIELLDKPQPQVIIEVLIADLVLDDARRLGSILRNPKDIPFPGELSAQSAMIQGVILDSTDPNVVQTLRGVNSDLNSIVFPENNPQFALPATLTPGSSALSISDSDGRTWNILEILKRFNHTKILSHPHIIATNNQKATIEVGESRLVDDQAAPSTSGITRRKKTIEANLNIYITPLISSADTVNLQVVIDIDQFQDPNTFADGNRINRDLTTNASVKSGDILALGGLVREITTDQIVQTPLLSRIPVFGWLFKRKNKEINQTSLTIFISPTIIQPKLRGGVGTYTKRYVEVAKDYSRQGATFDNLRDPITRWFFRVESDAVDTTDDFLEKDETTEVLHAAEISDIVDEEARLLDEHEGIHKPFDEQGVLIERGIHNQMGPSTGNHISPVVDHQDPQSIQPVENIQQDSKVKDKQTLQKQPPAEKPVNAPSSNNTHNNEALIDQEAEDKTEKPIRGKSARSSYRLKKEYEQHITPVSEVAHNDHDIFENLKKLLEKQDNPLEA